MRRFFSLGVGGSSLDDDVWCRRFKSCMLLARPRNIYTSRIQVEDRRHLTMLHDEEVERIKQRKLQEMLESKSPRLQNNGQG